MRRIILLSETTSAVIFLVVVIPSSLGLHMIVYKMPGAKFVSLWYNNSKKINPKLGFIFYKPSLFPKTQSIDCTDEDSVYLYI